MIILSSSSSSSSLALFKAQLIPPEVAMATTLADLIPSKESIVHHLVSNVTHRWNSEWCCHADLPTMCQTQHKQLLEMKVRKQGGGGGEGGREGGGGGRETRLQLTMCVCVHVCTSWGYVGTRSYQLRWVSVFMRSVTRFSSPFTLVLLLLLLLLLLLFLLLFFLHES